MGRVYPLLGPGQLTASLPSIVSDRVPDVPVQRADLDVHRLVVGPAARGPGARRAIQRPRALRAGAATERSFPSVVCGPKGEEARRRSVTGASARIRRYPDALACVDGGFWACGRNFRKIRSTLFHTVTAGCDPSDAKVMMSLAVPAVSCPRARRAVAAGNVMLPGLPAVAAAPGAVGRGDEEVGPNQRPGTDKVPVARGVGDVLEQLACLAASGPPRSRRDVHTCPARQ